MRPPFPNEADEVYYTDYGADVYHPSRNPVGLEKCTMYISPPADVYLLILD
jgi:hypothetical protein